MADSFLVGVVCTDSLLAYLLTWSVSRLHTIFLPDPDITLTSDDDMHNKSTTIKQNAFHG
ncbi:hypothetical protein T4A_7548 [Trichinella pseudospiralis]|uniref:Uncharacterized protein n=1 Tax=Trichinella pseudospiralis TaxID=6337 RepID=A0A0V1DZC8_TRIPS|nr:hypothetical protein T4A_7548 [Trichinella pseudospiralis]